VKIDAMTLGGPLGTVADQVRRDEDRGYDGWFVGETAHDPLLSCVVAGQVSDRLQVGTGIAVAFPRSPMHVAYAAHDLQALTGGRFVLGLGSQIKAHVEKRFSTPWSRPAARMRDYVLALKTIWNAWETGERLRYEGEFYRHTLMTPFFTPQDHGHGAPPVWVAAVGPRMTEVTGEVADGLLCHGFTTDRYLTEVTLPTLTAGARTGGRTRDDVEVALPVFVVTGRDDTETADVEAGVKAQIAFYGSTPAYRPVLDLHGWGDLHERLHARSLQGDWGGMTALIDDEVLHTFAVVAPPDEVGTAIRERYEGLVDRVSLYTGFDFDEGSWARLLADVRGETP
jgi:probable F420-dependent oxidoreductase